MPEIKKKKVAIRVYVSDIVPIQLSYLKEFIMSDCFQKVVPSAGCRCLRFGSVHISVRRAIRTSSMPLLRSQFLITANLVGITFPVVCSTLDKFILVINLTSGGTEGYLSLQYIRNS